MKNYILVSMVMLFVSLCATAQTTAIPDINFEKYLETHDANGGIVDVGDDTSMGDGIEGNGIVFTDRIDTVTSLIVNDLDILNLNGIEDFIALETLICNENNLSTIDVSNNSNLITLLCSSNQLTDIDISANTNLKEIDCSSNQISLLNVTNNTLLESVNCSNNRIEDVDVSQNIDLVSLSISNNRVNGLNIGNNTKLESLYCASNQIVTLDVSSHTYLKILDVSNNALLNLDLSTINSVNCPNPQTDPVTACQGSSSINVSNNQLTSLIVANGFNDLITTFTSEGNPDLFCIQVDTGFAPNATWTKDDWTYYGETACANIYTYVPDDNFEQALINLGLDDVLDNLVLTASINGIENLDVSNSNIESLEGIEDFGALQTLNISDNVIEFLDISNNTLLTNFDVSRNSLVNIDLSNQAVLTILNVANNDLEELDLSVNLSLENLNCSNNTLQSLDLSANVDLTDFDCAFNTLQALNIQNGQNVNLSNFDATNNPDLSCIQADTNTIPGGVNWAIGTASLYSNCGTYVPDNGFEQAIIDAGFDVGPLDNYVPTANIENETNLDVSNYNIVDLTGIQDFTDLQTFNCSNNNIVELNLTENTALTSITCNNNDLEFVDIRNGNNANTTVFNATNNPNLFCINIDAAVIANIPAGWMIDPIASYNDDCENNRYTAIPDDNFEQALIDLGLDNGPLDNQVLTSNIEYLTSLNVSGENIESLEGIKAFLSLIELDCSNNYLDELDVSGMVNLEELFCGSNYFLTNNPANVNGLLNTTGTTNLTKLFCSDNSLSDIDVSINANLEILDCSNNEIVTLDISGNNSLIEVNCDNNQISNFVSYAVDNSTLTNLSCNNNELSTLLVNRCLALRNLNCRTNVLTLLDISANAVLEVLDFSDNELADLNLSANTNLIALSGSQNELTEIDDLSSIVLETLILDNNQINQLSAVLNGLVSIKYLSVSNNQLTDLDVNTNINLIELNASNNDITNLQLPTNLNQLKTFNCSDNEISGGFDLSNIGTGTCPAQNEDNPLDFCPDTITINVSGNQLDFVNIQNGINSEISSFSATENPNLTCIQVDDVNTIGANWIKDATAEYSIDCRFGETYVPDDNFEQALINLGYDVGPLDDYVPTVNIQVIATLDISGNSISDLTGIEDFEALQNFNCSNNAINTIDVSNNVNLIDIDCSNNTLESLDLTNNLGVTSVNIANNSFLEFDVSLISLLEVFNCDGNTIVELDFSTNTALTNLSCVSNELEVLNLQNGANTSLTNLNAQGNPNLSCIQTDNGAEPSGVTWLKDATAAYAIDCHFGETYVPDDNFEQALIDFGLDTAPLDDYVPTINIQNRTSLDIADKEISDLTGIEDFENLVNLNFGSNTIAAVDLSNNALLESIDASGNDLSDLDISNLIELRVLDISENNFTQLDFGNNLGLTNLNISENDFSTLDVSLLLDIEGLNCASNQLTELDVTLNSNLLELICSSNLFFQDKLNIQNGANQFLTVFNASDNPDLSCILVDNPVAVISNVDGTYDDWFKDPTATYQTVCDDADNDGVANEDDLCPGTPFGEAVDLFGCTYSPLPEDNFTILITGETCLNNNDGKINIITKEFYEYKAHLVGDDFDREYTFTKEIDILNLLAGTYRLCITSDEIPNFQRCFDIIINHPENLDVITGKRKNGKEITVNMSGSSSYNIDFNGLKFTTSESQLTLQLEHGKNTIKISTDLPCQGEHEEIILLSNNMFVHPNPFQNELNLYLGEMDSANVQVSVYSSIGQMVFLKEFDVKDKRSISINTTYFNTGLYTVFIQSNNSVSNFKIVKK
ncbi:T9SS type A sorting domain-containing protein [Hyunsoonleella flava]|uniref:T9SS type A sorting domain-containing protein n=2 Tax=Pseudomonadati TaxID=3379134 RepID=A0A4Q9FG85_9FLAO|nr:T9SS type A sorting domain-containing protein [Hyunsoonleella flava]TBN04849.1 T9SS type A sorting domain-containing protein [Hyunsoonleella flava]